MRVAIVNDMLLAVEALRRVVITDPTLDICWVARDGKEAIEKCKTDLPDIILMDLIMPVMDGVEATRRIMDETPCPILVVTATVEGNASKAFEAMGYGALDAVATPTLGADGKTQGGDALLYKIATIGRLNGSKNAHHPDPVVPQRRSYGPTPPLLAIGCSTGGPKALADLLSCLDASFEAGIVVIQHVDPQFADGLAHWLESQCSLKVRTAQRGDRIQAGTVLIAASDDHLVLSPDLALTYTRIPADTPYRPSVDAFFHSVAEYWKGSCVAALLTGMGKDGAKGLLALRQHGFHTICQDKESSVVWGMPKAAVDMNAADEVLPIGDMAHAIMRRIKHSK